MRPFKSPREVIFWLLGCIFLYAVNCAFATGMSDVPWIKRGMHFSPAALSLICLILYPVIQVIRCRIATQPRD
jgi:hypothetical protein